jgi:hypothetical protein
VLLDASPGIYNISTFFFEFDGANLNAVPGSPNAPYDTSYYGNMLVLPTGQILISGHYFNGFSQGAAYGDTCNLPRTNPLLRITNNATGHAFYSRTHDHSSMAVAFGGLVSTNFDVPANQETGLSELVRCRERYPLQSAHCNSGIDSEQASTACSPSEAKAQDGNRRPVL